MANAESRNGTARTLVSDGAVRSYWSRGANWIVGGAAAALLAASLVGYFLHRNELSALAAGHLRLLVLGPSTVRADGRNTFSIRTATVDGRGVAAGIEARLYGPDEKQLRWQEERTDRAGRLAMTIPVDPTWPDRLRLELAVQADGNKETMSRTLRLAKPSPAGDETQLAALVDALMAADEADEAGAGGAGNAAARLQPRAPKPSATSAQPRVDFFPESGRLVAGLRNRVYFVVQVDGRARPVDATVVDGDGDEVADAEPLIGGVGAFAISPAPDAQYRLRFVFDGKRHELPLPAATLDPGVAIGTGKSVFEAGETIEFTVMAARSEMPLVVVATCGGMIVGAEALVTGGRSNSNPLSLSIEPKAAGIVRLAVYSYLKAEPALLAERFVYRHAEATEERAVGPGHLLTARPPAAAAAVDVGLAAAGRLAAVDGRLVVVAGRTDWARRESAAGAPLLFDNMAAIQGQYLAALEEYRSRRIRGLDGLTAASFFGGFALVMLVPMMALLGVIHGLRLWIPAMVAAMASILIGAVLMDPERLHSSPRGAVPFSGPRAE